MINQRTFNYNTAQETFSSAEVVNLLSQHKAFIEGNFEKFVSPEAHEKIVNELKTFTDEKDGSIIQENLKGITDTTGKLEDIISKAGITAADSKEEAIKKAEALLKTEANAHLKPPADWKPEITQQEEEINGGVKIEFETPPESRSTSSATKENKKQTIKPTSTDEIGEIALA